MATIKPYATAAGKRYRVRYRKPDKTQTDKRGFKTKKEAELFAASVTVSKATGDYIDPVLGNATVAHLADAWLAGKQSSLKPSAYRPLESGWRTHVEPAWGGRALKSIQPSEVQTWVGEISADRSATTAARALGVLSGILDQAVADRKIGRNPARGAKVKKKRQKRRIYLNHDQVHTLAAASEHPELVLTLAYTGLRWGEASGLRVRSVNEVRRRLAVEENAVLVGSEIHVGTPKTHEKRTVPYPKWLGKHLAIARGKKPSDALLFGDGRAHLRVPDSRSGWFARAVKAVQADQQRLIDAAVERGEECDLELLPRVTPHDLRHTAASLAVASGANVKAVQRMLGHASAAMTLDTYADLFDDDLDAVADRLGDAALAASEGKPWAGSVSA